MVILGELLWSIGERSVFIVLFAAIPLSDPLYEDRTTELRIMPVSCLH